MTGDRMAIGSSTTAERVAVFAGLGLLAMVLVRTAWVCDDAYITFRTVDNLIHGYGARWNVAERVQSYTHPLWMLTLAAVELVTREPYFTSIVVSFALSLVAAGLVAFRLAHSGWQAATALLVLAGARSFVDFSSSGLDNALSHALLAWYLVRLKRPPAAEHAWQPIAIAALVVVNRQDVMLLVGPSAIFWLVARRPPRPWRTLALGLSPVLAWELFSLVYYGFVVPNTAFAKMDTGIPERDLFVQGLRYLQESLLHDPLTLVVIAASVVVGLMGTMLARMLALGQCLYLAYTVCVGGDFMSGRFLTAPLFIGVAQLASMEVALARPARLGLIAGTLVLGLIVTTPNMLSNGTFGRGKPYDEFHGVTDERLYYYPRTGLLRSGRAFTAPDLVDADLAHRMLAADQHVATREMVGMFGFAAGPDLYVVDRFSLGEPLTARLPVTDPWRIGHFQRALPDGLIQTLRSGTNQFRDPGLAAYYDALALITRGPLFSFARLREIAAMNLGRNDRLLDHYRSTLNAR
jgi:arabinofuranosyltransferase